MRKMLVSAFAMCAVGAITLAHSSMTFAKLPKCAGQLCKSVNCSADVLCASGTTVKTSAEVCAGGH